jgi:protein disulfide-isomerase
MRRLVTGLMMGTSLVLAGCHRQATQQTGIAQPATQQIAWREGDVDDAFAEAKESQKPVLLYWGAKWCPPCNMMKQTLFKDPSFIAETRDFVPVYLDGDAKGAQLWGEKFGIQGYPTVIILRPDHSEITRLSGGSAASSLTDVLRVAAKRTISTEELLKRAADPHSLSSNDWALLANYDWLDDPKHFKDQKAAAAFLDTLARNAPDPAVRRHFALTSLVLASGGGDGLTLTPAQQAQLGTVLPDILSNYAETKTNRQLLGFAGAPLVLALSDKAEQRKLGASLVTALDRVAVDDSIPLGDRLQTVYPAIGLSKAANSGKVSPDVLAKVRQRVAFVDRAASNPMLRQAVMPDAGEMLDQAGDHAAARKLLENELPHAIAPYYFMIDLASMAEDRKDNKAAIAWARKAAETAEGPATRIQWAILYSDFVLRLTPADKAAVEQSAGMVIDALGHNTSGYAERTEKKVTGWAAEIQDWSKVHDGRAVLDRLAARMTQACAKGGGCKNVLSKT